MASHSRTALAVHRVLLRTARTPLGRLWAIVYRLAARLAGAYLARGERGATTYVRGSLGSADYIPGLSDIDLVVVLAPDARGRGVARRRAGRRWRRMRRALPATRLVIDYPRICEQPDLADLNGASALTYGLDGPEDRAGYLGVPVNQDRTRMLERPGLYGATADWRRLAGPDRRPPEPAGDAQLRRIAAWLELIHWWQWVFPACMDPQRPRTAHLCHKLVAEPARIWLWLARGERASDRADVLHRVIRRMPEEADALRRALDLGDSLPDSPAPPLAEVLPVLVRLSARIAALIAAEVEAEGAAEVRLVGVDADQIVLPHRGWRPADSLRGVQDPPLLPLCDWRTLADPRQPDESFAVVPGDPGDPELLAALAGSQGSGPYPALVADGVMVFPALTRWYTRLRAVQCRATAPVPFALAEGNRVARFPGVRGWSAEDTARRAVAEHRAWLRADPGSWWQQGGWDGGVALGIMLTAGRAALFLESIRDGAPELALTVTATARRLAERSSAARAVADEALDRYREYALRRTQPPPATLAAMRKLTLELPAYAGHATLSATGASGDSVST